jgi:hypothetical protein
MPVCNQCHHEFEVGRFCTNCGHPVGAPAEDLDVWRTDTAERPAVTPPPSTVTPAPPPPPAETSETSPRLPLFVDEVEPREEPRSHRADRAWLPWAVGAIVLVVVAGLGAWLLLDDDSEPDLVASESRNSPADKDKKPPSRSPKKQKQQPTKAPPPPARPTDVANLATATVPATAAPGTDFDGNVVRYEARNMLDGVSATCWRMPGDGSGQTITLELAEETRLRSVGLINGYAKTATSASGGSLDWYAGNRRVLAVEWLFDDGSVVTQDLTETRRLQTRPVDPVTTSTVELRLITVTPPGTGPSRRDYTAISDVALVGSPA